MRLKAHKKLLIGALLMAFWSIILVSQVANLKIQNCKFSKATFGKQSTKSPVGSPANDNQSNPIEEEEEDDDEFNLESALLNVHQHEIFIVKHFLFQNCLIRDPHREIFSPPPQA